METETLYYDVDLAVENAVINCPQTASVKIVSDFANQSREGYNGKGEPVFRIYRTFDKRFKQCYQIRYCYTD